MASGFSITGAVSTNTLTAQPCVSASQPRECLELLLQHLMVVAAARVDADRAALGLAVHRARIFPRPVVDTEADDAPRFGPEGLRVGPPLGRARHPRHVSVPPFGEVLVEVANVLRVGLGAGEAGHVEAARERAGTDRFLNRLRK